MATELDLNTYDGIAEFYDVLMTNGYYNYAKLTKDLEEIIGERKELMELGVGTGLIAERLLKSNPEYKITGIDNTPSMLEQAKERLGDKIKYELQDVTQLSLENKFDAAFSVGGCWYFIDKTEELEFCSHIDCLENCKESLRRVVDHLKTNAVLALALQAIHTNYSKRLDEDLTYSQEIFLEKTGFVKRYRFENSKGIIAEQFYRYLTLPALQAHNFFAELNCEPVGLNPTRKFFVYRKIA